MTRRILAAVLSVCMAFSLCVSAFADEGEELVSDYPHFSEYTVLGDSNAASYGLTEYEQAAAARGSVLADNQRIDSGYAAQIADAVGAETVHWNAHSAWRTTDFLRAVGYDGFSFTEEPYSPYKEYIADRSWVRNGQLFISAFGMANFDETALRNELHDSIADSDLVSVQFGSNDIFTYMLMALIEKWGDIFTDLFSAESMCDAVDILVTEQQNCPEDQKALLLADVVNACEAGLKMFKDNFPKVLDYIMTTMENKDGKIMVMGVMNPVEDLLNYSPYVDFDFLTVSDTTCYKANVFLYNLCQKYDNVIYVSTTDCDGYGLPAMDWEKLTNGVDLEPVFAAIKIVHPSERGHEQIAARALDNLCAKMVAPVVKATVTNLNNVKLEWSKVPGAVSYRVYRSTRENGPYLWVYTTGGKTFTDLTALPKITYYYKVVAVMNMWGTVRTHAGSASATPKSIFSRIK